MQDKKILIFDVDGTLAPSGEPMKRNISEALFALEQAGNTVCLASGGPCLGLEGVMRGVGLKRAVVIGENGAAATTGIAKSPLYVLHRPVFFNDLEREISRRFQGVYFQHNMVNVSVFHEDKQVLTDVAKFMRSVGYMDRQDVTVYMHNDCVEVMPSDASKGNGLARLKNKLGWKTQDMVAVGDGKNDISMKSEVNEFYTLGSLIEGDKHFKNTDEMMVFMREQFA